jgi:hypothetical protein
MLYDPKKWPMPEVIPAKPEVEPWRKLLLDAIKVIQKRGWHRGDLEAYDGSVCTLGALQVARHGMISAKARYRGSQNNYSAADHRKAVRKLQRAVGGSIVIWNDARYEYYDHPVALTKANAIATIKRVAKS